MSLFTWLGFRSATLHRAAVQRRQPPRRTTYRPHLELLEDRCLLASGLSASLVADINPGEYPSNPQHLTNVNGTLYFGISANGGPLYGTSSSSSLWKSDGTAAGTVLVKDVFPQSFTSIGGSVFFTSGGHLWKTDGTTAGTVVLFGGGAEEPTAFNDKVVFAGEEELWISDGTLAGTVLLKDIYPGTYTEHVCYRDPWYKGGPRECYDPVYDNHSVPRQFTNVNGTLFFAATDGTNGRELWKTDGTPEGTILVKNIAPEVQKKGSKNPGPVNSDPVSLTAVNSLLYFVAAGSLWKSDGTAAGTVSLKTIAASNLTAVNGTLFFSANDGINGDELWKSDGTAAGTVMVKDINAGSASSSPISLANVNGTLFFSADNGASGHELWKSNGTAAGTVMVKDIKPGSGSSDAVELTNVNGRLYFSADDGTHGQELWQSDGTAAGTVMVQDINEGVIGSYPIWLVAMNNKLYFASGELFDPPPVEPPGPGDLVVGSSDTESFTDTDPVTPASSGGMLRAVAAAPEPMNETLRAGPVQPLPSEALARWQGAELAASRLSPLDLGIAELPGATLGEAVGQTLWLDVNAAGWGWFSPTLGGDSAFLTPANQGERHHMDLLTVGEDEGEHALGDEHTADGVMAERLAPGTGRDPSSGSDLMDVVVLDRVFSDVPVSVGS